MNPVQLTPVSSGNQTQMTITLPDQVFLALGTGYQLDVPAGAVQDLAGNPLTAAAAAACDIQFQTEQSVTLPQVHSTAPLNGTAGVSPDQAVSVTFNEDVAAGPDYGSIAMTQSGAPVAISAQISNDQVTITPANPLSYNTAYAVSIPAGSVQDTVYGDLLKDAYDFSFTTGSNLVSATSPAGGATGVPVNAAPAVVFDQAITGSPLGGITIEGGGNQVTACSFVCGDTILIAPLQDLGANEQYTVDVPAGAVTTQDGAPNTDCTFSFTTGSAAQAINAFNVTPQSLVAGSPVSFDASGCLASATGYCWDFGDGSTGTGAQVQHTYSAAGPYTVTLVLTDSAGDYAVSQQVSILAAPNPAAASLTVLPAGMTTVAPGQPVTFTVNLSDGATPVPGQAIGVYHAFPVSENTPPALLTSLTTDTMGDASYQASLPADTASYILEFQAGNLETTRILNNATGLVGISGYVTITDTWNTPAGATVSIGGQVATVDSTGFYSISGLSVGTYTLTASDNDHYPASMTVTLSSQNTVQNITLVKYIPSVNPVLYRVYSDYTDTDTGIEYDFLKDGPDLTATFQTQIDWKAHDPGYVEFLDGGGNKINDAQMQHTYNLAKDLPLGGLTATAVSADGSRSQSLDSGVQIISGSNLPLGLQASQATYTAGEGYKIPATMSPPSMASSQVTGIPIIAGSPAAITGSQTKGTATLGTGGVLVISIPDNPSLTSKQMGYIVDGEKVLVKAPGMISKVVGLIQGSGLSSAASASCMGLLAIQISQSSLSEYTYDQATQGWDYDDGYTDYIVDTEGYLDSNYPIIPGIASLECQFTLEAQLQSIVETLIQDGVLVPDGGQVVLQIPKAELDGGLSFLCGAANAYAYLDLGGASEVVWTFPGGSEQHYLDLTGGAKASFAWGAYTDTWQGF